MTDEVDKSSWERQWESLEWMPAWFEELSGGDAQCDHPRLDHAIR